MCTALILPELCSKTLAPSEDNKSIEGSSGRKPHQFLVENHQGIVYRQRLALRSSWVRSAEAGAKESQ